MNLNRNQDVFFDDKATLAMGAVFDQACRSLRRFGHFDKVRELIAKRIIEAAKAGEADPIELHSQALMGFSIDDVSVPIVSLDRDLPVPVYALIACTA
jgi:hypothetical protein